MKSVLIVDDSPFFIAALGELLSDAGFDVTTAGSGEHAQEVVNASLESSEEGCKPFDLIITDLVMPGISGFDLSEFIRKKNQTNRFMPVIMLSEKEITKEEARKNGCSAYIPKSNLKKVVSMTRILLTD